jgi:Uma2 family endonuclease
MNALQIIAKPTAVRLPKAKRLTYEEYARLTPPDSSIYELHNGQIVKMPTPTPKHQLFSTNLVTEINIFIRPKKLGRVIAAPMDTVFTPNDVLQPDILFLSTNNLHLIGDKKIEGAPDLVVEILSPSNHAKEMAYKKMIYELSGVREYWLVNLENQTITQYENLEKEFVKRQVLQKTDVLQAIVLQGFQINVASLFE